MTDMVLQLPNLDDRRYEDLVEEGVSLIPAYSPDWTNYNPADPGITLIELFAHLAEMLTYRVNRVTDAQTETFLKLLNGPQQRRPQPIEDQVRETIDRINRVERAVTRADFERLALAVDPRIGRVLCVPGRDLESGNPSVKPAHVSVIVVPASLEEPLHTTEDLLQEVRRYLETRRLLATVLHVVGPFVVTVGVRIALTLKEGAEQERVRADAPEILKRFLHPITGGPAGDGWPFGRYVHVSDIYELLENVPGVDQVSRVVDKKTGKQLDELTVSEDATWRLKRNQAGELVSVELHPYELIIVEIDQHSLSVGERPETSGSRSARGGA